MELAQHFERFLDNMNLDVPKLNRIRSEHTKLRGALEADQGVLPGLYETFLQGSYVHGRVFGRLGREWTST